MNNNIKSIIVVSGSSCLTGDIEHTENELKEKKEECISFRCTKEQKDEINKLAKKAGISNSQYITDKCFPEKEKNRKSVTALRKRQEFVNQINSKINECNNYTYEEFINKIKDMVKDEEDDIHADVGKLRT